MTHILHVVDLLQVGGAQKLINCFAGEAVRRGVGLSVASLADISGKIPAGELAAMGVPVTAFPANHLADPNRIAALVRYMRSQPFDLVHTHLSYANILGGLAGRLAGIPVVATLHSSGNDQTPGNNGSFTSLRSRAESLALRFFATRVMAVGESVAQAQRSRMADKPIEVIVNAVQHPTSISIEEREARRRQILGDCGQTVLISVGRFAVVKELPDLVVAFQKVKNLHPEAKLVLIGDGSERLRLETLITNLNLDQDIILLGRRSDVTDWLQSSDLYVSASSLEGLPVSILEAMAVGLPVVATEVGDVPRVLLPEMGSLVPAHRPDRLAEAICVLLDQPEQRRAMGKAAMAHITQNFEVSDWFNRILALYGEVLGKNEADLIAGWAKV